MDELNAGAVHVWQFALAHSATDLSGLRRCLSDDEIRRADRFHFAMDRDRYVIARFAMRSILAAYLDLPPGRITFSYTVRGKPLLAENLQHSCLHFNLSHSGERAMMAITKAGEVGADIEFVRRDLLVDDLAASFFSPGERKWLGSLGTGKKQHGFYKCPTGKEAYTKAQGAGLSIDLNSFEVVFSSDGSPCVINHLTAVERTGPWRVYGLKTPLDYVASLVVAGHDHGVVQREWYPGSSPSFM